MAPFDAMVERSSDLAGEFGLIARLTGGIESRSDVVLGAGDDAALLDLGAGALLVATVDAQVAGVHFVAGVSTPEEIGHKSLAVNLSDLAAMGAEPLWALVSLLLPHDVEPSLLDRIYAGMRALARRFDIAIVGGNVAATSGPLTLDVTLLGRVARERAVTRSGGRPGDHIYVTGELGAPAAGVLALIHEPRAGVAPAATLERVRRALVAPEPLIDLGRALAATGAVTAMLDVSDGLAGDLRHLCERSGVGAVIQSALVPVSPDAAQVCAAYGRDPLELALTGGEDYALLFTAPPDHSSEVQQAARSVGATTHIIGELTADASIIALRQPSGALGPMPASGWDHLRSVP